MSTKTMASTLASTGRSMKNLEIMPCALPRSGLNAGRRRRGDLGVLGGDLAPRNGALGIADHHAVLGSETAGDLAQIAEELAYLDHPLLDRIVLVHQQQIAAELAGPDRHI